MSSVFKRKLNGRPNPLVNAYLMPEDLIIDDENLNEHANMSNKQLFETYNNQITYTMFYFFRYELVKFIDKKFTNLTVSLNAIKSQVSNGPRFSAKLGDDFNSIRIEVLKSFDPVFDGELLGDFTKKALDSDFYNPDDLNKKELQKYVRNFFYEKICRIEFEYKILNRNKEFNTFLERFMLKNKSFLKHIGIWQIRKATIQETKGQIIKISHTPSFDNFKKSIQRYKSRT